MNKTSVIKIITVTVTVIIFYCIAIALFSITIVNPVLVAGISLALALFTSLPVLLFLRNREENRRKILTLIIFIIGEVGFYMSAILAVNYFGRNSDESVVVQAKVERIYSENRQRTRRVRGRYVASGDTYKVYYMEFSLPDGTRKIRSLSTSEYNRYAVNPRRRPSHINLSLTPGLFSWPIIKRV